MNSNLVRIGPTKTAGIGVFVKAMAIPPHTIVGEFEGEIIRVKDELGNRILPNPVGDNIICIDDEMGVFLDGSKSPDYGEPGYMLKTGRFFNSSHPKLKSPYKQPNCYLWACPETGEAVVKSSRRLEYGEECLFDYHWQLVKLGIHPSCGCKECRGAMRTPIWNQGSLCSQRDKARCHSNATSVRAATAGILTPRGPSRGSPPTPSSSISSAAPTPMVHVRGLASMDQSSSSRSPIDVDTSPAQTPAVMMVVHQSSRSRSPIDVDTSPAQTPAVMMVVRRHGVTPSTIGSVARTPIVVVRERQNLQDNIELHQLSDRNSDSSSDSENPLIVNPEECKGVDGGVLVGGPPPLFE